jgi:hypothetical protein
LWNDQNLVEQLQNRTKNLDLFVQCTCIYDETSMTMLRTYNTKVYESSMNHK